MIATPFGLALLLAALATAASADEPRPRARDLGLTPGVFPPGRLNAIHQPTDKPPVQVEDVQRHRAGPG